MNLAESPDTCETLTIAMTSTRTLFRSKTDLFNYSRAFLTHEAFDELMAHARAHLLETRSLTVGQQEGVKLLVEALQEICEGDSAPPVALASGLIHQTDPAEAKRIRQQLEPKESQEKKENE